MRWRGDRRRLLVESAQGIKRVAEIAVSLGEIWICRNRLPLRADRSFEVLQFVKSDTQIALGCCHGGLDLERSPRRLGGKLGTTRQPKHLAEIGVE
jgi:hypothetical protein